MKINSGNSLKTTPGMFSKKTSVAHTNQNKLWSCRGLSTWFALESSSSTQVPWPVDQLTKAIVGIKLTSGSRSFQHLPCWFWNLEFLSSIWGLHGFTSWVWWMERIARKHGCQDASFYQTTSQLIIFINISTFVFLTKSSFETQIPKNQFHLQDAASVEPNFNHCHLILNQNNHPRGGVSTRSKFHD